MSNRCAVLMVLSAALVGTALTHGEEKSRAVQLTSDPAWDYHPRWSPDGSMIAFTSQRNGSPSLWIMAADGTGEREVAGGMKGDYHIAWSPDGSKIAYVRHVSKNGQSWNQIFVLDVQSALANRP